MDSLLSESFFRICEKFGSATFLIALVIIINFFLIKYLINRTDGREEKLINDNLEREKRYDNREKTYQESINTFLKELSQHVKEFKDDSKLAHRFVREEHVRQESNLKEIVNKVNSIDQKIKEEKTK